ncbi:MAG TPA: hypothetical protein VGH47_00115 [Xanthobacteraceae bacterium]|jgi:hypothetical protein
MTKLVDHQLQDQFEERIRMFGIRAVLRSLVGATDLCAGRAAANWNIVQAKQWAAWSATFERLAGDHELADPGRE